MIRDDCGQVDIDSSCGYVLTAKGRLDLQIAIAEERMAVCSHTWHMVAGDMECLNCGYQRAVPSPAARSIPAYLSPKDRK